MFDKLKKISFNPAIVKIVLRYALILVIVVVVLRLLTLYLLLYPENSYYALSFIVFISIGIGIVFAYRNRKLDQQSSEELLKNLSKREREVFDLLLKEKSNQDICDQLFIEKSTLKSHINRIYKKLRVSSRNHLSKRYSG